jgi:hypothetical protein
LIESFRAVAGSERGGEREQPVDQLLGRDRVACLRAPDQLGLFGVRRGGGFGTARRFVCTFEDVAEIGVAPAVDTAGELAAFWQPPMLPN